MEGRDIQKDLKALADAFYNNLMIDNCEYGGIGLDDKRPFGNSSVTYDILEIINMPPAFECPNCGVEYSEEQRDYADSLYHGKLIGYLQQKWEEYNHANAADPKEPCG